MLPNSPIEQISRSLSDLKKRIERLERLDQVFTINPTETVINEAGINRDLRIEGDTEPNLFFVNAGTDRIGIGTATPLERLHIVSAAATIRLQDDDEVTSYTILDDASIGQFRINKYCNAGTANIDFNPIPSDGVSPAAFRFFRQVNTTGQARADFFKADGTGTIYHRISNRDVVFNQDGIDMDFRIEGSGDPNLFFVDAGNDNVGIGTAAPNASAKLEISSTTGSLLIPRMTTAQRNALGAVNGMGIYNTSTNQFEKYQAGAWVAW